VNVVVGQLAGSWTSSVSVTTKVQAPEDVEVDSLADGELDAVDFEVDPALVDPSLDVVVPPVDRLSVSVLCEVSRVELVEWFRDEWSVVDVLSSIVVVSPDVDVALGVVCTEWRTSLCSEPMDKPEWSPRRVTVVLTVALPPPSRRGAPASGD
jgi:hypothetical protein